MGKKPSLKYQVMKDLEKLQAYGSSKKQISINQNFTHSKTNLIHSISTYDRYLDLNIKFGEWAKENYSIKYLNDLKSNNLAKSYLEYKQKSGDSPYSLRLYGSAIAKLMQCSSNDFGFEYPIRNRDNITRSRKTRFHDTELSLENNKDIIKFGRVTGLRRKELGLLKPEQIKKDSKGNIYIEFNKKKYGCQTKGGRDRTVQVLDKDHVIKMKVLAEKEGRTTIFEKVNNRIDEHSLRRKYATAFYKQLVKIHGEEYNYFTKDGTGRKFDRNLLRIVSNNLGHNRLDVIVKHYLD